MCIYMREREKINAGRVYVTQKMPQLYLQEKKVLQQIKANVHNMC